MNGILIISSKIGTPIWSREYVHSFGLRNEETHQIKAKTSPVLIKDGGEGVVGDITSLVATKTHHISDMSLSGLLYALKLNGEMCFIQDALNSSNIENELINFEILKSFEFGNCHLSFYECFDDNVYCVAIYDTIMLETSNFVPDYLNIGNEDQLNGTQFCNSITRNVCDKFCELFRKEIQNTSVRKAFKAFKPHLNVIYRDVIISIGQQMIYDCTCCDAKVGWLHVFNIKNCPNIFNPIEIQIVEQKPTKKNSKSKNTVQNIEMANTFTKELSHFQWTIELENDQAQVIILVNDFLNAFVKICKLFPEIPNFTKVRAKIASSNTFQECYIVKFKNTFACLPLTIDAGNIDVESDIQSIVNIHLERIDKFLETIQPEISPQITNVKL